MQAVCHISGAAGEATHMLRFVRAPDGVLTPDLAEKLPGTALYVLNRHDYIVRLAAQENVPPALPSLIDRLLREQLNGLLGLARKAGAMVTGFGKVEAALMRAELHLLLAAQDGAADGRKKLAAKAARAQIRVLDVLTADELGMALGRTNVIHAGATNAGWAARIWTQGERITAFRSGSDGMDRSENA